MQAFSALLLVALVASASAFMPVAMPTRVSTRVNAEMGKYDGTVWTSEKKDELYEAWDPKSPRSPTNFNPFEPDKVGNSPNESGYFPGEGAYKDPMRPDVSWATMQEDNVKKAAREANPKDGDVPGAPGRVKQ